VGLVLLIIEPSWSHSNTPHQIVLLCVSYQPIAETSTWQNTPLTTVKTNMSPAGLEPVIPASERPKTHGLDRVATGIGRDCLIGGNNVYVASCVFFQERNHVDQRRLLQYGPETHSDPSWLPFLLKPTHFIAFQVPCIMRSFINCIILQTLLEYIREGSRA